MQLSQKHADEKKKCIEQVTGEFFGKFTAISHISILVGTIFMSVVFESVGIHHTHDVIVEINDFKTTEPALNATDANIYNVTSSTRDVTTEKNDLEYTTISTEDSELKCGLYYKFADTTVEHDKGVSDIVMYVLLSAYLGFNLVAALLCLCLDEVKGSEKSTAQEAVCVSMLSINSNGVDLFQNKDPTSPEEEALSNGHAAGVKKSNSTSSFQLIKSTIKVLATDKAAWLLIPFTLHYGMVQGFARGVYNASWITCALGENVMLPIQYLGRRMFEMFFYAKTIHFLFCFRDQIRRVRNLYVRGCDDTFLLRLRKVASFHNTREDLLLHNGNGNCNPRSIALLAA